MSDRGDQIRWIRQLIGASAFETAYTQLGLSPDWADPIFGLTDLERLAIWIYTTPRDWHLLVNDGLWSARASDEVRAFASILNEALHKLPRFSGTVYRGTFIRHKPEVFLRNYGVGEIVAWPGFTSTTRTRRNAYAGNVLFRIESINGRSLQGYGADEADEEVLFRAGTRYKVLGVALEGTVMAAELVEVP